MAEAITAYRAQNGLAAGQRRSLPDAGGGSAGAGDCRHEPSWTTMLPGEFGQTHEPANGINGAAAENLQAGATDARALCWSGGRPSAYHGRKPFDAGRAAHRLRQGSGAGHALSKNSGCWCSPTERLRHTAAWNHGSRGDRPASPRMIISPLASASDRIRIEHGLACTAGNVRARRRTWHQSDKAPAIAPTSVARPRRSLCGNAAVPGARSP